MQIKFKKVDFLTILNTYKEHKEEIVLLTDKNSKVYLFCFEPNFFIAFVDGAPVGFINIDIARCKNYNNFIDIWIAPKYRGKGYGYIILKSFEQQVLPKFFTENKVSNRCIAATINKNNLPSIKLFLKVGFKPIPRTRQKRLLNYGTLKPYEIRLIKCYEF